MVTTITVDTNDTRSPLIAAPTMPAISFRGQTVTPHMIVQGFKDAMRAKQKSRSRILTCRSFRRKDPSSKVKVSAKWRRKFPEAASVANLTIEERITLERNLIAAVGAVEPAFEREPIGFRQTDLDGAEECQAFLEEWRLRCVPTPTFNEKSVEDGEFALTQFPCDLDLEGSPDYFEYISEAAYTELDDDTKSGYSQDEGDKRGRYVKRDADGGRVAKASYLKLLAESDADKQRPAADREKATDARHAAAQKAHDEDVAQYILRKQLDASAVRIIPALDCAPVFKEGTRRNRWELAALFTRKLMEPWDILDAKEGYGWNHLGDRRLIPLAYDENGAQMSSTDTGVGSRVYVYTAYLPVKEKKPDGTSCTHILIATTVGGAGTWDGASGVENDPNSVSVIDLYEEYGIEGDNGGLYPFVTYHGGLRQSDDDSDHNFQPYIWALIDRIKAIEEEMAAIRITAKLVALTGHVHSPDPRWTATEDGTEAILDQDGDLRKFQIPGPGETSEATGIVTPFQQAQVGRDMWQMLEMDLMALEKATAIDQVPAGKSQSGYQLMVQTTLGQVAKRHNRECVQGAVVASGEAFLRICYGIWERYKIKWPLRTVQERPVKGEQTQGRGPTMFDPEWVKDSQFNLTASFPAESNIAEIDLEASLYERGIGNLDRVYKAMGEQDADAARFKRDRDRLNNLPAADALRIQRVARAIGDAELEQIAKLQADQLLAPETPGVPGGVPTASLNRGGQNIAGSVRGAVQGAQMRGDAAAANAETAIQGAGVAA